MWITRMNTFKNENYTLSIVNRNWDYIDHILIGNHDKFKDHGTKIRRKITDVSSEDPVQVMIRGGSSERGRESTMEKICETNRF